MSTKSAMWLAQLGDGDVHPVLLFKYRGVARSLDGAVQGELLIWASYSLSLTPT